MSLVKRLYSKVSLFLFDNKIGIVPNFLHTLYSFVLKVYYVFFPIKTEKEFETMAASLRKDGYLVIPPGKIHLDFDNIQRSIQEIIGDESRCSSDLKDSGLFNVKKSTEEVPKLVDVPHQSFLSQLIKSYYKSFYRIFRLDIYRTIPPKKDKSEIYSLLWHFDNAPAKSLKVMVYLTDTTKENGAICLVPRPVSRKLKVSGFWDRFNVSKYLPEIEKNKVQVEGKKGTVILFMPQFCIHKAVIPEKDHRDVAVFLLFPSLKESNSYTANELDDINLNGGYIVNPFSGRPLKKGYGAT